MLSVPLSRTGKRVAPIFLAALVVALGACSSGGLLGSPEKDLERSAVELNDALAAGDAETAWGYYSSRCKQWVGNSLIQYRSLMREAYEGRSPDIESVSVSVNGSAGQVITIDNDPAAPPDSMRPKTWSLIDGKWVYDNCF